MLYISKKIENSEKYLLTCPICNYGEAHVLDEILEKPRKVLERLNQI